MLLPARRSARRSAFLVHLIASVLIACGVGTLIFGLWYPGPFRHLAGGVTLFLLIAAVDTVLGPMLTLLVFDERKSRRELSLDLSVIVLLQAAALAYGAWTMATARPVWLAFEVDLFRVVTAADVEPTSLPDAPPALRALSWRGPGVIGTGRPQSEQQKFEAVLLGASGIHLAYMPRYWQTYASVLPQVQAKARPVAELRLRSPHEHALLDEALGRSGVPRERARWLPVLSAQASWIAIVDEQAQPRAFAAIDSY